jgi:hypothetical protein
MSVTQTMQRGMIGKDLEWIGCGRSDGTTPKLSWRKWRKLREPSVTAVRVQAEHKSKALPLDLKIVKLITSVALVR